MWPLLGNYYNNGIEIVANTQLQAKLITALWNGCIIRLSIENELNSILLKSSAAYSWLFVWPAFTLHSCKHEMWMVGCEWAHSKRCCCDLCALFEKENKRPHAGLEWAQGNRQATTTERRGSIVSACPDLDSYWLLEGQLLLPNNASWTRAHIINMRWEWLIVSCSCSCSSSSAACRRVWMRREPVDREFLLDKLAVCWIRIRTVRSRRK